MLAHVLSQVLEFCCISVSWVCADGSVQGILQFPNNIQPVVSGHVCIVLCLYGCVQVHVLICLHHVHIIFANCSDFLLSLFSLFFVLCFLFFLLRAFRDFW